jgi:hypothetical protein
MKKIAIVFSFLFIFVFGCQKQEVQLPIIEIAGITEIQNHSSIWIFYDEQEGDETAILNKNNKIINTHWIFNIDKRLTMKTVVPHLSAMQENRDKDSMHKKGDMLSYFSYADTSLNQISLTPFPPVVFTAEEAEFDNQEMIEDTYLSVVEITNEFIRLNDKMIDLQDLKSELDALQHKFGVTNTLTRLKYNENTEYQSYLQTKVYLTANNIPNLPIEYMFSLN